jgi:hypothetical protein
MLRHMAEVHILTVVVVVVVADLDGCSGISSKC